MGHLCGSTCKRKTGQPCQTCRKSGGARVVEIDARGKPVKPPGPHAQATPHEKGAAVEMYFDGLSYRQTAGNMDQFFGRETTQVSVYRWVRDLSKKADDVLRPMKVDAGRVRVADEVVVRVGGKNYWLFNMMDSQTRFLLAAYLSPTRTTRDAATALALARQRSNNPPVAVKTETFGLASYRDAMPRAFPTHRVRHVISKGVKADINNNLSERLQGTIRDRDKTLRGLKAQDTRQAIVDRPVTHYNPVYFRPHESLKGKPRA